MTDAGPEDDYLHLGPKMRARLDEAEGTVTQAIRWLPLLAERSYEANVIAREICLVLGQNATLANIERTTYPWEHAR
jgi:hypothetical protein